MGLDTSFSRGMPTGLYVSAAAPAGQKATKPTPVTITVGTGVSAGVTTVSLSSSANVTLEENQILVFNAGDPDEVALIVTAQTAVTGTPGAVPVDAVDGVAGDGIPGDLASSDTATWDQMYRVLGTETSDFNVTEGTQELSSVTYDSGQNMSWDEQEITSRGWNIPRGGRFKPNDPAYKAVRACGLSKREVWVKRILADEDGAAAQIEQGRATVTGFSNTAPASGIVDANWTFQGQGEPEVTDAP